MENFHRPENAIKHWASDDRPREKMLKHGGETLSNSELLAIIINNGNKESSALDLAKEILQISRNNLDELGKLSLKDLQSVKGIGPAKAVTIAAMLELGRRRSNTNALQRDVVRSAKEMATYLRNILKDFKTEAFVVVFLNRANKVKDFQIVSRGGITGVVADPRIILKKALDEEATSIILSHNHPSGNLSPSYSDKEITYKIKEAAKYFDITVADHIIVSDDGYFSFADEGIL